jgi:phosphoribosyl-ATP pyrophosphohydrolase/phosphoribosyl-AMP cyclohydrolase
VTEIDWQKMNGMIPAIVQDAIKGTVLMLGYMNRDALEATRSSGHVTFWSRSKNRLWTKGETSGNHLRVREIAVDCDGDTLLILATPVGPACHLGTATCFGADAPRPAIQDFEFLGRLDAIIESRIATRPAGSYTSKLLDQGLRRMAQKVGEEGLETALAAVVQSDDELLGEAADLLFHAMLLLRARKLSLQRVVALLEARHDDHSQAVTD